MKLERKEEEAHLEAKGERVSVARKDNLVSVASLEERLFWDLQGKEEKEALLEVRAQLVLLVHLEIVESWVSGVLQASLV